MKPKEVAMGGYVAGWGTLAIINAGLANASGRSPLKYFLGSLLLGPIITILIACTRESPSGALQQVDLWRGNRAN
jgi:hypothetical protein